MRNERERRDGRRSSEFWVLSSGREADGMSETVENEVFGTSNPEHRTSCRAFPASLARLARLFCGLGFFLSTWV